MTRIGIAGIAIESSTFSPHRTGLSDFTVTRGDDLLARYAWISGSSAGGGGSAASGGGGRPDWSGGVEWVPLLHAVALPGGPVLAGAYTTLKDEILKQAGDAGPLDGLLLDIHGAMSVEGLTDAEADLARALRAVLGDDVLISASMDLHGNVSPELAGLIDLITCYRMAPHEDAWETRERAARNLAGRLRRGGRPALAWVPVPVLLPGEKTSTRIDPARSIYQRVREVEAADGVLDAAIWVGYAWADEPRCQAAVVVTGDEPAVVTRYAGELARAYWEARDRFSFVAPAGELGECLAQAIGSRRRPFFISDSGDNPTAGGAGDVSWTLARLLADPAIAAGAVQVIQASITDPAAVAVAFAAGQGAAVTVSAGGKIDAGPSGPVTLAGTVHALRRDDPVGGALAVIAAGGLKVILTSRRKPYHTIAHFTGSGVDPLAADIIVVKAGYLEPELYQAAADWRLALTPGGVDQDLLRLDYRRLARPLFPFDPGLADPDLTPRLIHRARR
ncbi:MAG: M81 family metallopeptidase [Streptosporangiaceae bacterium]